MSGRAARRVVERVYISGTLRLETPTHLGNGDVAGLTDMPLLLDPVDGKRPLLTGTSIAGALRNYVREFEHGYGVAESSRDLAQRLFGAVEKEHSLQSWLLIEDSLGDSPGTELRDGVSIDAATHTAEDEKKYDIELLEAGTSFDLAFELVLGEDKHREDLLAAVAVALDGLQQGEVGLGQRKRRGLGRCRVDTWQVCRYDLGTPQGLVAWLEQDRSQAQAKADIFALLGVKRPPADERRLFSIHAEFGLPASLLIRSGSGAGDEPDAVHLCSRRGQKMVPILSGTSLAGALRARALRIAQTVRGAAGRDLVESMFGRRRIPGRKDRPSGSRVLTRESELEGTRDMVQSRVKIDRFTGGSFPQALFSEQPAFGGDGAGVQIEVALRAPRDPEIGLLLLVLKDLWTGDLPLGGEGGVGRGRLKGQKATLLLQGKENKSWTLEQKDGAIAVTGTGSRQELEDYVDALKEGQ